MFANRTAPDAGDHSRALRSFQMIVLLAATRATVRPRTEAGWVSGTNASSAGGSRRVVAVLWLLSATLMLPTIDLV